MDVLGEQLEPTSLFATMQPHSVCQVGLPARFPSPLLCMPSCTCIPGNPLPLLRAKFQEALAWQPPPGELVLRQQCALLAALCGAGGGDGANELATQALQLLQGGSTMLGLQLLTALAQEAEDLDRVRRLALVNVLSPRGREVLGALGALLAAAAQQLQQGGGGELPGVGHAACWWWNVTIKLRLQAIAPSGSHCLEPCDLPLE